MSGARSIIVEACIERDCRENASGHHAFGLVANNGDELHFDLTLCPDHMTLTEGLGSRRRVGTYCHKEGAIVLGIHSCPHDEDLYVNDRRVTGRSQ